jgi:hypothetical protein
VKNEVKREWFLCVEWPWSISQVIFDHVPKTPLPRGPHVDLAQLDLSDLARLIDSLGTFPRLDGIGGGMGRDRLAATSQPGSFVRVTTHGSTVAPATRTSNFCFLVHRAVYARVQSPEFSLLPLSEVNDP